MTENTNYIGIAMGLDVTDLKAGLADANKQIQLANSEFKAASSGMDNWQTSIEGVSAKVKQLDTVLGLQKSKLAGLQAEYEKVSKSQGENSEAARKLKVQINNQQAVVNATQKDFDNYNTTLKEAKAGNIDLTQATLKNGKALTNQGKAAEESSSKLGGLRSVAKGVAGGIAAISAAVVGAVGGFLSLAQSTREFREDQAKLDSAFKGANLSANSASKTYKTLFGIIGESDTAVEASQQIALLANSEEEVAKWSEVAAGVVGTFGDALKVETFFEATNETIKLGKATGAFTQMLEGTGASVDDFNAGLAACTTEEEKQAYMLEISNKLLGEAGKAYNETAKDIIEAREAEASLTQAMAELGVIAEPIMTSLKLIAVDLLRTITPFVELIGNGLKGALEGGADAAQILAEGIGGLLNVLLEKAMNITPAILNVVLALLPQLVDALLGMLPELVNVVTILIAQLISTIATMLPQIVKSIMEILPLLINSLVNAIPQILEAAIQLLMAIIEAIPIIVQALVPEIPKIITTIVDVLLASKDTLFKAFVSVLWGLLKAIPQVALELYTQMPKIIKAIVKGLTDCKDDIKETGLNLVKGIWEGIKSGASWLKNKITDFAGNVADWFKDTFKIKSPSKLMADEVGLFIGEGIGEGVLDSLPYVKKQLSQFSDSVANNLGNIKYGLGNASTGTNSQIINAGLTVNYNGNLSRKQLKQLENDNYNSIKMRLRMEGEI